MATKPRTPEHFPKMKHRAKARQAHRQVEFARQVIKEIPGWMQQMTDAILAMVPKFIALQEATADAVEANRPTEREACCIGGTVTGRCLCGDP